MTTKKRVLDVGQCDMDHGLICQLIEDHFDAVVTRSHHATDALEVLRSQSIDLVLVNRLLDRDHSEGLELIRALKTDEELSTIPVMMITNFAEHDQGAVAAGALPGFGKAALDADETRWRLGQILDTR